MEIPCWILDILRKVLADNCIRKRHTRGSWGKGVNLTCTRHLKLGLMAVPEKSAAKTRKGRRIGKEGEAGAFGDREYWRPLRMKLEQFSRERSESFK